MVRRPRIAYPIYQQSFGPSIPRSFLPGDGVSGGGGGGGTPGLTIPAALRQLLFHDDGTATEYPAYYTEEEWPNHSHLLKDYSLGVGSLRPKRQGYCYDFDGVNDYARAAISNTSNAFTLACWVNPDSLTSDFQNAMSLGLSSTNWGTLFVNRSTSSDNLAGYLQTSTATVVIAHTAQLPTSQWSHIALTWNGATLSLWLNGVVVASNSCGGTRSFDVLTLGANSTTPPNHLAHVNGKLSDSWYLNRAATADEITYMRTGGASGTEPTGVIAHYPMQEESGTVCYDISGNGNHGDILNSQAGFHAVDAGVVKSYPNDEGFRPAWVNPNPSTQLSQQIATPAQLAGKTNSTLTFKVRTTDAAGVIFGNNTTSSPYAGVFTSGSGATSLVAGSGTPVISVNGVTVSTRGEFHAAIADGDEHDVEIAGVDFSNYSNGLYFDGYGGGFIFTGEIWDVTIDGVEYPGPVVIPAASSTLDALGGTLTETGRNPNYGLVPSPAWQGNGTDVYVDLGASLIPASADFELEVTYYHTTNDANRRCFVGQGLTAVRIQANSDGLTSPLAGALYFSEGDNGTGIAIYNCLQENAWHTVRVTRVNDTWTLICTQNVTGLVFSKSISGADTVPINGSLWLLSINNNATARANGRVGYFSITTGGVTTTYYPLEGTRDVAYTASNGTGGILSSAVVGGTLETLYTDGDGSWRNPVIEHGGRYDAGVSSDAVLPGRPGTDLAANGLALTIPRNKAPMTLDVNRTGGVVAPGDVDISIDGLTAEAFNQIVNPAGKRFANAQYSDRYGAGLTDVSGLDYFTEGNLGSLSVNGKAPVAAWVPSLDTSGNGTTTLNDLIGSNDGTLTNMDAATDWVADTDAGGVRALDFDGTNDLVSAGSISFADFSISLWLKHTGSNSLAEAISNRALGALGTQPGFVVGANGGPGNWIFYVEDSSGNYRQLSANRTSIFANGTWTNVVCTREGNTTKIFVNGVDVTASFTSNTVGTIAASVSSPNALTIGNRPGTTLRSMSGRLDDIRIFDSVLNSSDIAYLYNSGNGRGRLI